MPHRPYATASVEVLDDEDKQEHVCDICPRNTTVEPAWALYNVYDGTWPVYTCGRHLTVAVRRTATRKGA